MVCVMSWKQKLEFVHHAKRTFKRKVANQLQPWPMIISLPESPADFETASERVFITMFPASKPVKCPIPAATLEEHRRSFPMRNTKKAQLVPSTSSSDMQHVSGMMQHPMEFMVQRQLGSSAGGEGSPHSDVDAFSNATASQRRPPSSAS